MQLKRNTLAASVILVLLGCGQKGALYIDQPNATKKTSSRQPISPVSGTQPSKRSALSTQLETQEKTL